MIRSLALSLACVFAGAPQMQAQTHPYPHAGTHSHPAGHVGMDSAQHVAMHVLLLGSWTGWFHTAQGSSVGMELMAAHDSLRNVTLTMQTDHAVQRAAGSDLAVHGDTLQWTQELSGASCVVSAVVIAATTVAPDQMSGTIACERGSSTFILRKRTG